MMAREISLYTHQAEAVERLRDGIRAKLRRQILVAPTAFGKTECAAEIIKKAEAKGSRVWFIVDRVTLIDQTSERFALYGIDHGIIQADHPGRAPEKLVQIASAQTIGRRSFPVSQRPDLIVVDEAHCEYEAVLDLIEKKAPSAKVIGLTATPFTPGMAKNWDGLVNGSTVNALLAGKFLAPLKVKACVAPDMTGAKKRAGEYDEEDAGERGIKIIGDVVATWIEQTAKFFGGPVKTIVFSPSVKHGAELCRQFADAGFNFQQISYLDAGDAARREKIAEFRKPDSAIDGLVSCAVLTKGFDVPDVLCGISCRPYRKSLSAHIQEMGRAMRVSPETGKTFGLWLDHSGNSIAFAEDTAWLYEHGVDSLDDASKQDGKAREAKETTKSALFCAECSLQMEPGADRCAGCGWERPKRGEIQVVQGTLIDFELSVAASFKPRSGLHAPCLNNPRRVWNAALSYCLAYGRKGEEASRKWALGVWAGIYPSSKLPRGLFEAPCDREAISSDEWSLIEREIRRFRKSFATKRRAA